MLTAFVLIILDAFQWILLMRALLSWFPKVNESKFGGFIYLCTEPILSPIRKLLQNVSFLQQLPVDFSILVAFLFVQLITFALYAF